MLPQEATLIAHIKSVGVSRSQEILNLLLAWEGETPEVNHSVPSPLSKKRTSNLVQLGQFVQDAIPKGQRGRRKGQVDPNSARQRIFRALTEVLSKHGSMACAEVLIHVENVTGLTAAQCKMNAFQCPGIKRAYGTWSLERKAA
jgi:hypothetical protein